MGEPRALAAAESFSTGCPVRNIARNIKTIKGLTRWCASQEGNALAVACRIGFANDSRAQLLARSLIRWQWPDGSWNCDVKASGRRSSFTGRPRSTESPSGSARCSSTTAEPLCLALDRRLRGSVPDTPLRAAGPTLPSVLGCDCAADPWVWEWGLPFLNSRSQSCTESERTPHAVIGLCDSEKWQARNISTVSP